MSQKILIAILAIVVIAIGLVYYYGGYNYGTPSASGTPQGPNQISMKSFAFNPAILNIKVGDTVTWTNNDSVTHDISGSGFKSPLMSNGQSYSFTFNTVGTYDYVCAIHPSMKGTVVVK